MHSCRFCSSHSRNNERTENFKKILWLISKNVHLPVLKFSNRIITSRLNDQQYETGRVFPWRLPNGGFLTIGYCLSYCFLKFFGGGQGLDGEGESCDSSSSPPTRGNPDWCSQYSVCMSTPP